MQHAFFRDDHSHCVPRRGNRSALEREMLTAYRLCATLQLSKGRGNHKKQRQRTAWLELCSLQLRPPPPLVP